MKVKELIEILSQFDHELDVVTFCEGNLEFIDYPEWDHEMILYKKDGSYWETIVEEDGIDESMAVNVISI